MIWNVCYGDDQVLGIVNELSRQEAQEAADDRYGFNRIYQKKRKVHVRICETARTHRYQKYLEEVGQ